MCIYIFVLCSEFRCCCRRRRRRQSTTHTWVGDEENGEIKFCSTASCGITAKTSYGNHRARMTPREGCSGSRKLLWAVAAFIHTHTHTPTYMYIFTKVPYLSPPRFPFLIHVQKSFGFSPPSTATGPGPGPTADDVE